MVTRVLCFTMESLEGIELAFAWIGKVQGSEWRMISWYKVLFCHHGQVVIFQSRCGSMYWAYAISVGLQHRNGLYSCRLRIMNVRSQVLCRLTHIR